jgi:hypothetical protein
LIVRMGRKAAWNRLHKNCKKVTPKCCKKVTTNVHYCSADGGREVGFVRACVRRRNSKLNVQTFQLDSSKRFSARSSNISARRNVSCVRQTFQLGETFRAFVKHFSLTKRFVRSSNISARHSARQINLPWRRLLCRTNERTHIFQSNFFSQMFLYLMYPNCLSFIWC